MIAVWQLGTAIHDCNMGAILLALEFQMINDDKHPWDASSGEHVMPDRQHM